MHAAAPWLFSGRPQRQVVVRMGALRGRYRRLKLGHTRAKGLSAVCVQPGLGGRGRSLRQRPQGDGKTRAAGVPCDDGAAMAPATGCDGVD